MTDLRTAAQAVLDRWDSPAWEWLKQGPTAALMADLRAALAEPVQEPVAYWNADESSLAFKPGRSGAWAPLYADPKPCPTCVSLARAVMMDQMGSA